MGFHALFNFTKCEAYVYPTGDLSGNLKSICSRWDCINDTICDYYSGPFGEFSDEQYEKLESYYNQVSDTYFEDVDQKDRDGECHYFIKINKLCK